MKSERTFSASELICTKIRSSLNGDTLDTLHLLRASFNKVDKYISNNILLLFLNLKIWPLLILGTWHFKVQKNFRKFLVNRFWKKTFYRFYNLPVLGKVDNFACYNLHTLIWIVNNLKCIHVSRVRPYFLKRRELICTHNILHI